MFTDLFPPSRRKLEWQGQDTPRLWDCAIQLRHSGIRAKRPTHLPALVAITQTSIILPRRRRLSPGEVTRLQGLPEWFDFSTSPRDAATYKQLGNGVNVGAVWYVLRRHVERDRDILETTPEGRRILNAVITAPDSPDAVLEALGSDAVTQPAHGLRQLDVPEPSAPAPHHSPTTLVAASLVATTADQWFKPAVSKIEAVNRISVLTGSGVEDLGPGSKERKRVLINLARVVAPFLEIGLS